MNQGYKIHMPSLSFVNKVLIILSVTFFVIESILTKMSGISLIPYFGLSAGTFSKGFIWQVFTYPLFGRGLLEVVFGCLLLWFIGCSLEEIWGRKRYLSFLLFSTVGAGLIYLAVSFMFFSASPVYFLSLTGLAGVTSALCLAYAVLFPDQTFTFMLLFPMKAKYFCAILIGMSLYQGFFSPAGAMAWGHLGGMAFGYLYMFMVAHPALRKYVPGGIQGGSGPSGSKKKEFVDPWSAKARKKKKNHLSLVEEEEDDDDDKPKYLH